MTCHRPPVDPTIESAMASPRPVPDPVVGRPVETVEQPGSLVGGYAGAAVLDGEACPVALGRHHDDRTVPPRSGIATGVVHQHAGESVDPVRWGRDQRIGVALSLHRQWRCPATWATAPNRSAQPSAMA